VTVRFGRDKRKKKRVGLLGGSFNPAHEGHRHVSLQARRLLGLNEVWWLVSPLNPFKKAEDMAGYETRLQNARFAARSPHIVVSDFERAHGTRYSIDTIRDLLKTYPDIDFVWLAGADILPEFHRWRRWREIMSLLPLAVCARKNYAVKALHCKAARVYRRFRLPQKRAKAVFKARPPCWVFLNIRKNPASSTAIRQKTLKSVEKKNG